MHHSVMTVSEGRRGCGRRKPGGLYLCSGGPSRPCGKLPIPLDICPTCGGGIKFARGWTWVNGTALAESKDCKAAECSGCPLGGPLGRCGLLWIGAKFYQTPEAWTQEARMMGVSRRIKSVPHGFKVGETWVLVAHIEAIENPDGTKSPGIFHAFLPQRIEYVTKGTETDDQIEALVKRGLTPVKIENPSPEEDLYDDDSDIA